MHKAVIERLKKRIRSAHHRKGAEELLGHLNTLSSDQEFTRWDSRRLIDIAYQRSFGIDETVFDEGMPNPALYIVRSGRVQLSFKDSEAHLQAFYEVGNGEVFGESALLGTRPRWLSATCMELTEVYSLFSSDLEQLFKADPQLGMKLYRSVARSVGDKWQEFVRRGQNERNNRKEA